MPAFEEEDDDDETEVERQVLRPTMTESEVQGPVTQPEKPKIVVLGASGRIGRYVFCEVIVPTFTSQLKPWCNVNALNN